MASTSNFYFMDNNGQIMYVQGEQVYIVSNQCIPFNSYPANEEHSLALAQQQLVDQQLLTSSILPTEQETLNSPLFSSSIQQSNNSDCSVAPASSPSSSSSLVYSQEVDEIVNLTNLLYQPAEVPCNNSSEVAEIAFDLLSSLPSSPSLSHSSSGVPSPSTMQFPPRYHYEPLPSIDTLSTDSLDSPHLAPIKKPFSFIPQQQSQPLSLPSFSPLPFRSHLQTPPHHSIPIPSIPSPQSPPSSPSHSPKRNKKNYTKEFNTRFHELLNHNEDAANQWHLYAQKYKARCTIKRSPCIKVSRGFCASYGSEFNELAKEERYGALGTRTECECGHKAAPLILPSSSSSIPAASSSSSPSSPAQRKQRTTVRPSPYPTSSHSRANPSTPQEIELPDSPQQDQPTPSNQWITMLIQQAPLFFESLNNLGGLQCSECKRRRLFSGRDEVTAYLMGEGVICSENCRGFLQLNVRP